MASSLQGGCACGAVRYQLRSQPFEAGWCHCTTCRRLSGAPGMVFASVPIADFEIVRGQEQAKPLKLSSFATRTFCGSCGTPLTIRYDMQPDTIDFTVATLDSPEAAPPAFHIFWSSRIAWFDPGDGLPRHDRFRPETVGLEGTEPPA